MPEVDINYWAVLVAGASSMVVGGIIYGPVLGKKWMQLIGKTEEDMKKEGASAGKSMSLAFLVSLISSYVLAHIIDYTQATTWVEGIQAALWVWLGFTAAAMITNNLFENRKWALVWIFLLNSGITVAVQGIILAVWQ